jgi:hypothetical protein
MRVYLYRFIVTEEHANSELGLAVAHDLEHLFWILDQFTDPYEYQFCEAQAGDAISTQVKFVGDELSEETEDPTISKYDWATEPDTYIAHGEMISDNVKDQTDRQWKQFIRNYRTIPAVMPGDNQ